jgi:regulation of enolase protein 1 (concanavalin A-like superfamily)
MQLSTALCRDRRRVRNLSTVGLAAHVTGELAITEPFTWLNEPGSWTLADGILSISTDERTDFWRHTFYSFERDNGHAWLRPVSGDFTASAVIVGNYEHLYDQAGLMLRINEKNWIKTGIEFSDGLMHFSVVATREVSDWSLVPLPEAGPEDEVHIRLTRHGDTVRIQYSLYGRAFQLARLTPFSNADAKVGVMACSPERAGFAAMARDISVGPAIPVQLHAD